MASPSFSFLEGLPELSTSVTGKKIATARTSPSGLPVVSLPRVAIIRLKCPPALAPMTPSLAGVDAVLIGVFADVPNGAGDVVVNLRDGRLGLGEVRHGEHRVAAPQERLAHHRLEVVGVRPPTAANHHHDAEAVGFPRLQEFIGQLVLVALAVNDPLLLGEPRRSAAGGTQYDAQAKPEDGGMTCFHELSVGRV